MSKRGRIRAQSSWSQTPPSVTYRHSDSLSICSEMMFIFLSINFTVHVQKSMGDFGCCLFSLPDLGIHESLTMEINCYSCVSLIGVDRWWWKTPRLEYGQRKIKISWL